MFCWKCGKEIPDEAQFCSYCGTEVKNTGAAKTDAGVGEKRDYRAFVAIGLIILLLLAAATILIGTLSNREKADTAAETPLPSEGSLTAAESPAPAETPAPTEIPEPTETPRPRFISPEQYARENGLDWPTEGSDAWSSPWTEGFEAFAATMASFRSWNISGVNETAEYDYATIYMQARAEGKKDQEAHEMGLEKTGVDRQLLGKEEYVQYIYDSAISAGISEYDAEEFMEQEKLTWDAAWNVYKYARDTGSSHEQAIGSVEWRCFSNVNCEGYSSSLERKQKYIEAGMSSAEAEELVYGEERDKLYSCLQYWYEIKREDIEA